MELNPQDTTEIPHNETENPIDVLPVQNDTEITPIKSNKKIIYIISAILVLGLATGVYAAMAYWPKMQTVEQPKDENPVQESTPEATIQNDNKMMAANEPDSEGISDIPPAAPAVTTPTKTTTTTPAVKKAPANNKSPETTLLSYGLEDVDHDNDEGLSISARATDPDGTISKVEIYIDGKKEATVLPHLIGGKTKTWLDDPEDIFDVTDKVGKWLEDQIDEEDVGYVYRQSKQWDNDSESCGISQGFVHFFVGKKKFYDVRTDKDVKKNVICKESEAMNVDDLYYFMWQPKSGSHDTYAIAYDQYGTSTKSNKVEFSVD